MNAGSKRDNRYACYSDLVDDVFRGLLPWLRYVCAAVAQARRELFDVLAAVPIQIAGYNVRPCPTGILDRWLDENDGIPVCICEGDGDVKKSRSDLIKDAGCSSKRLANRTPITERETVNNARCLVIASRASWSGSDPFHHHDHRRHGDRRDGS
jgi:hypothetical protein